MIFIAGLTHSIFPNALSPLNLEPRKNLATLLAGFASISPSHPDLRLVLFGKAGSTEEREREFDELTGRLVRTSWCGTMVVSEENLDAPYAGAEIFVFPSLYEGFGYPVLEAMSAVNVIEESGCRDSRVMPLARAPDEREAIR